MPARGTTIPDRSFREETAGALGAHRGGCGGRGCGGIVQIFYRTAGHGFGQSDSARLRSRAHKSSFRP